MDKKVLYVILDTQYLEMFGRKPTYESAANLDLYPSNWGLNNDFDFKVKVLVEALNKKIKITDTELYQKIVEGPRSFGM